MKNKITATIQARMGSSRLPGKVLADISGKPMLLRQVERIKMSRLIDEIIICTSTSKKDDEIVDFCNSNNINYYRGPEDDVLKRISDCVSFQNIDIHVEFCGDSPLPDYQIIDEIIALYFKHNYDAEFFTNSMKTTFPPGTEVSVYSSKTLLKLNELLDSADPLREHVGTNIKRFPKIFRIFNVEAPPWFNYPEVYLEVDTENDLKLIRKIFKHFIDKNNENFQLIEIINMLKDNPKLIEINNKENRRWKVFRDS